MSGVSPTVERATLGNWDCGSICDRHSFWQEIGLAPCGALYDSRGKFEKRQGMVLPHRIELWTSSLPMRCSTTELRQLISANEAMARRERGGNCHTTPIGARQS